MKRERQTGTETQIETYKRHIIDMLDGRIPELRGIPRERLGWSGISAFHVWYGGLSGKDRKAAIGAMRKIIENGTASTEVVAQVINLATSLGLTQLEPQVRKLKKNPIAKIDFVKDAINEFSVPLELNRYVQEGVERGELPPR